MKTYKPGLAITAGRGFHLGFANGYTVSVQFGARNYCDNRGSAEAAAAEMEGLVCETQSPNAEIAAWDAKGNWYTHSDWGDDVCGWVSPDDVAAFIAEVQALPSCL